MIHALHFKMSPSKPKCQHTDQTIKEKIEKICKLDCGVKAVELCKQFNLSQSTLSTWKKQRSKLNKMVDAGKVLHTKCNCKSLLPQVDRALHLWFCEMRSKPHAPPINQALLIKKDGTWNMEQHGTTVHLIHVFLICINCINMCTIKSITLHTDHQTIKTAKVMDNLFTGGLRGTAL